MSKWGNFPVPPPQSSKDARIIKRKNASKVRALEEIDEKTDQALEEIAPDFKYEPSRYQRGDWKRVVNRAHAILSRLSDIRRSRLQHPFRPDSMERAALLLGHYHGFRHTPRIERAKDWPKSFNEWCAEQGVEPMNMNHLLTLTRYYKWEKRYLDYTSPEVRMAMVKDVLFAASVRQLEAEPGKENANLLRTALQGEGELKGTQKITQVNVGSNVLNMPENLTEEDIRARLDRVNRLAESLKPKEVPHKEVPHEP